MQVDTSPRSFVDDPAFGAKLDQLDRGLTDEGLSTRQLHPQRPASISDHQACEDAASAAPSLSRDPAFFERLGTTLDDLDHLASRSRGASADDLGIPASVKPHEGPRSSGDGDQDQAVTDPSTFRMMVTRTVHVAMFIACMGLGGLAAAFVFHDRLAQLQLF